MAAPITEIRKPQLSEEEVKQQKLNDLKTLLAENETALAKMMEIASELNSIGILDAADHMLLAKDEIAKIALGQVSRKPVTNLLNTLLGATGALMKADPGQTSKLLNSAVAGMDAGSKYLKSEKKVTVMDLLKTLNDPDINRAIGFGLHFLRGMGKDLKED
ncbi:DUF1641 domain-containing protein [Metabacillus sp. KIGAM252]|uniref:DUF1641 domain-containing protein n=1 Tax=Metabacillus flavus TaxID=2823519 RepID=A0ABS5LET0_9BACI|nr:DUF1641 domain-containing protein [Metabacillus flavus]MBS2969187.1 DUF1641 domain-containing protein [Metabacillus flavus]